MCNSLQKFYLTIQNSYSESFTSFENVLQPTETFITLQHSFIDLLLRRDFSNTFSSQVSFILYSYNNVVVYRAACFDNGKAIRLNHFSWEARFSLSFTITSIDKSCKIHLCNKDWGPIVLSHKRGNRNIFTRHMYCDPEEVEWLNDKPLAHL